MKSSLKGKLILSYLAVSLLTVLVVSVLIRLTSGQSLMNLVVQQETADLKNAVQVYYTEFGTLEGFSDYYRFTTITGLDFGMMDHMDRPPMDRDIRVLHGLVETTSIFPGRQPSWYKSASCFMSMQALPKKVPAGAGTLLRSNQGCPARGRLPDLCRRSRRHARRTGTLSSRPRHRHRPRRRFLRLYCQQRHRPLRRA